MKIYFFIFTKALLLIVYDSSSNDRFFSKKLQNMHNFFCVSTFVLTPVNGPLQSCCFSTRSRVKPFNHCHINDNSSSLQAPTTFHEFASPHCNTQFAKQLISSLKSFAIFLLFHYSRNQLFNCILQQQQHHRTLFVYENIFGAMHKQI